MNLDEVLARLSGLPDAEKAAVKEAACAATASMRWLPSPGAQTDAYRSLADILLYGGSGGGGKMLCLRMAIPTPTGWSTVGDLKVGDALFDERGQTCHVTAVHPVDLAPASYRLRFDDGVELDACADHLWLTYDRNELDALTKLTPEWRAARRAKRPSGAGSKKSDLFRQTISARNASRAYDYKPAPTGSVRTTAEIAATLLTPRGTTNHAIPVAGPLDLPEADLPIDPYVLGAWLGDGNSRHASITCHDPEILDHIASAGFTISPRSEAGAFGINGGLIGPLRSQGLLANKHIPSQYLRASIGQRLALLQGLMDTDGNCTERGACEFTTTRLALRDGFKELISSLGIKGEGSEGRATLHGRDCGPKYRFKFMSTLPAFRLSRKLDRQSLTPRRTTRFRYIVGCDRIDPKPMRCITVDSPSRLYLAGRSMVPTHNTDLALGLAFTAHRRSLILRRKYTNLDAIIERGLQINGTRDGFNGSPPPKLRTSDGRVIVFGANQHAGDEQGFQGQPFDLKVFDEATQFLESQVRFHLGWLRSTDEGQRVRALLATNPPIDADGDWIIGMFRPWLDVTHPKPAKHGELRWFVTAPDGSDMEVDGPEPIQLPGAREAAIPMSRTFIPAALKDNPFLVNTGYQAKLDGLPEPLRSAVRDGNFMAARQDADFQVIPTAWIIAAQDRWTERPPENAAMTAMGLDPAGGGRDSAELICRYGGWFSPLVSATGPDTADGSATAATVVKHRRDNCPVVVDVGGGYGGGVIVRLKDNGVPFARFNGADGSTRRTKDGTLTFANKRAEAWWRMREELDPDQEGGSPIALPPDPELRSDLSTPTWKLTTRGILLEAKEEIRKRIGRSPGKGDAAVMALAEGERAAVREMKRRAGGRMPEANIGHAATKRLYRR